jgi:hypothetical protein
MKIDALAIVALLATEASAFVPVSSRTGRKPKGARAPFSKNKPLYMADEYKLDTGIPKTVTTAVSKGLEGLGLNGNAARLEKLKTELQLEIAEAEADRIKVLQAIAEAEGRRGRLEQEATKVASEVEARRKRLTVLEEQAARASAGGAAGAVPLVVGGLGAVAATITAARSALATREKVLEEKKQQAEEARLAAEKGQGILAGGLGGVPGFAAVSILSCVSVCSDFLFGFISFHPSDFI